MCPDSVTFHNHPHQPLSFRLGPLMRERGHSHPYHPDSWQRTAEAVVSLLNSLPTCFPSFFSPLRSDYKGLMKTSCHDFALMLSGRKRCFQHFFERRGASGSRPGSCGIWVSWCNIIPRCVAVILLPSLAWFSSVLCSLCSWHTPFILTRMHLHVFGSMITI